jgi:hypothetical protein
VSGAERTQRWVGHAVFACGVVAGMSWVVLATIVSADSLVAIGTWLCAGFVVLPFFFAAAGIWLARGTLATAVTCLLVLPVIWVGVQFTCECVEISRILLTGRELKETWQSGFGMKWGMIFVYQAYGCGILAWWVSTGLTELVRRVAVYNGRISPDCPDE